MRVSKKSGKFEEMGFQMAPMIDVVFLLLIFFMCASTFHDLESREGIDLPIADKSKTEETTEGRMVVNVDNAGMITFQNYTYTPEQLGKQISGILEKQEIASVLIRGDKDTDHKHVMKIMELCAQKGIWKVWFATYKEENPAGGGNR